MAERQKYEKWLRDLDLKRSSTPPKVFERVHADYSERLEECLNGLRQHTTELQEHARSLMVRLKELEISEEELLEEQSENELRSQVGELSEDDWESSKKKADRLLAKFKEDQAQIADDLNQIRQILNDARGTPSDTPPTGVPRTSTDFDELAFLTSVVGDSPPEPEPPRRDSKPAETKRPTPPPSAAIQPQAATPSVAVEPEMPQSPAPAPPTPSAAPNPPKAQQMIDPPKPAENLIGNAGKANNKTKVEVIPEGPAVIRTSGIAEQQKTLKCAECGAMNYASEWYCERCGAELANI